MDISKSINKLAKKDQLLSALVWNSVIEFYKTKKNIDISPYLISIKSKDWIFFIKTQNPMVNQELWLYQNEIIANIKSKLEKLNFTYSNIDIKYK